VSNKKTNPQEAGAEALASYEGKEVQELIAILAEKDAQLAAQAEELKASDAASKEYSAKIKDLESEVAAKNLALENFAEEQKAAEEIISSLQETISKYEAEIAEKAARLELQDERINKVLGVLKVRGKFYRPLRRIAKIIGRTIIFAEELRKVRPDAVLFKDLSVDEQWAIISEHPHIFKVEEAKDSITA